MNKSSVINFNKFIICFLALLLLISISENTRAGDHLEDNFIEVYDTEGAFLFSTARNIVIGDEYISEDNYKYKIISVQEDKATAEKIEKLNLKDKLSDTGTLSPLLAQENEEKTVGLYFTHNGESYQPPPINVEGRGDVHRMGDELASILEDKGISVNRSDNLHLPHDGASYTRSRSTALELAQQGPDALFDIHRDAIPNPDEYLTTIDGEEAVQVRLVLGRQNPNREVNEQFAYHLKAVSDENQPGLIKDIFYGQGEYNQSLHPRALLLEIGTHKNQKEQALKTAAHAGEIISLVLYGDAPVLEDSGRAGWITAFWIIILLTAGVLGYLYMIERNWTAVKERLKSFIREEILDRGDRG